MPKPDAINSTLHAVEVANLRAKITSVNERYKQTLALLREADSRLRAVLAVKDAIVGQPAKRIKVKARGRSGESTAFMVGSDWHLEERVDPKTVDHVNEYNLDVAERRVESFFKNGLAMIEMLRSRSRIDTLVMPLLGDLITGYIHDELAESNYLSPTEATLKAYMLVCGGIDFLLKHGKLQRLIVPCCVGNHGRTTPKMRVSTATRNSYEWLLYQFLSLAYRSEPRVEFQIANGYFVFMDVYDTKLRLHHGDDVRYEGGVGGLTIPLNKAIGQWNKMRRVDVDVLGHWHSRISTRDFVVNGSAIGYSPYSIRIKASFEPPSQSFFLIHPERGKTVEIPLFL